MATLDEMGNEVKESPNSYSMLYYNPRASYLSQRYIRNQNPRSPYVRSEPVGQPDYSSMVAAGTSDAQQDAMGGVSDVQGLSSRVMGEGHGSPMSYSGAQASLQGLTDAEQARIAADILDIPTGVPSFASGAMTAAGVAGKAKAAYDYAKLGDKFGVNTGSPMAIMGGQVLQGLASPMKFAKIMANAMLSAGYDWDAANMMSSEAQSRAAAYNAGYGEEMGAPTTPGDMRNAAQAKGLMSGVKNFGRAVQAGWNSQKSKDIARQITQNAMAEKAMEIDPSYGSLYNQLAANNPTASEAELRNAVKQQALDDMNARGGDYSGWGLPSGTEKDVISFDNPLGVKESTPMGGFNPNLDTSIWGEEDDNEANGGQNDQSNDNGGMIGGLGDYGGIY